MGGIEVLFGLVIFIVGMVGLVRGAAKELGVTMALIVLLALFSQLGNMVSLNDMPGRVNKMVAAVGMDSNVLEKQQMPVLALYSTGIILTALFAYHGRETLKYGFKNPPGLLGLLAGWFVGSINGYLMFGTIWYYMHQLNYPIKQYSWFRLPLTELGESLVRYLPQNLASGMVFSGLAMVMLWWKILK